MYLGNDADFEDALETVKTGYYAQKNQCELLRGQLQNYSQTDEIAQLKARIDELHKNSLLIMSNKERESQKKFIHKHWELHKDKKYRTSSDTYQYTLTETGFGTIIKIKCPICGAEEDITDILNW